MTLATHDGPTYTHTPAGRLPAIVSTRSYEPERNVLKKIETSAGQSIISSYTYSVNDIGQRRSVSTAGTAFGSGAAYVPANWSWDYDSLGQLIDAHKRGRSLFESSA